MTLLAIDNLANVENGLYTGEEICAMLGEHDGIAGVGVEMELDPEVLSSTSDPIAEEEQKDEDDMDKSTSLRSIHRQGSEHSAATVRIDHLTAPCENQVKKTIANPSIPPTTVINMNRMIVNKSISRRSIGSGRFQVLKRQMMAKAATRLKSVVKRTAGLPLSPRAQRALTLNASTDGLEARDDDGLNRDYLHKSLDKDRASANDSSTCSRTQISYCESDLQSASTIPSQCTHSSSITQSTCDFTSLENHGSQQAHHSYVVFEKYLVTDPWEAAKRGDFATLSFIADHDDEHVWTQVDHSGHVPLYYACVSYCRSDSDPLESSFGKYGLESVRLLVDKWPSETEFPEPLLKLMQNRNDTENVNDGSDGSSIPNIILHEDVLEILSSSGKSKQQGQVGPPTCTTPLAILRPASSSSKGQDDVEMMSTPDMMSTPEWKKEKAFQIDNVNDVTPHSFLADLGDDGYVEDY